MKCTGDRHYALLPMTVIGAIPVISTVPRLKLIARMTDDVHSIRYRPIGR